MNIVFDTRPIAEIADVEVEAYIVRLCRAAPRFKKGAEILADARKAFDGIEEKRLKACAAAAANKLIAQGGYAR